MLTSWSRLLTTLLLTGVLTGAICLAQPGPAIEHQSWSTDAGLPQSSVHQILQSHDGYLWLATEGGVVRYDGVRFAVFNHEAGAAFTSNDSTSLAEARGGDMWFGTADGLVRLRAGKLRRYAEPDGLLSTSVLAVAATDDGAVVVLTAGGVVRLRGDHFEALTGAPANISDVQAQPDGSVLLLSGDGVVKLQHGVLTPVAAAAAFPLRGMIRVGGDTWMWGDRDVVLDGPGGHGQWRVGRELPGSRVQTVYPDRSGATWVGTNRGLVVVTGGAAPKVVEALGVNSVLSVLEDAEGNMWVGTETSGLHALRPRKFRQVAGLADDEVSCVTQASDGSMWVGTKDDGLRRVRGDVVERPAGNAALTSPIILALAAGRDGDVWAGTPDGLSHVTAEGRVTRLTSSDSLPDDLVRSLLVAGDGTVWAGTRRGLAHVREGQIETLTQRDGLGADLIGTMYEAHDGLWVATLGGVSRIGGGKVRSFGRSEGLTSSLVSGMVEDRDGRLWVATRDAGVLLLRGERFAGVSVPNLPRELLGVLADGDGFLWLRDRQGVLRVSAAGLAACAEREVCRAAGAAYGMEDGMPSVEVVANGEPSGWRAADGALWFPTRKGVAIAEPRALALNTVVPPVVIERFLVDNEAVDVTADEAVIASGRGRYTFDFTGLSFTVPAKVLYSFRLDGFDQEWSEPSARRSVSYTNLPEGTYTFRVRAANNDGVWNEAGAQVRFRILPPVYRRWWFGLLVAVCLGAAVLGLYRLRTGAIARRYEAVLGERSRIAREIHDTLAQDMVGISLQLDMVTQLLKRNDVPEAVSQVKATRGFVQQGIEEARQSIWNLRANTAQDSLPARVKAAAAKVASAALSVRVKMGGEYRPLAAELEAEVLRVLQESLSNVERHARAAKATVQLTYGRDTLVLVVEDDGCGFDMAEASERAGHFGLRGMRERAAAIGAEMRLTSRVGEGTMMEMKVPVGGKR